MLFHLARTLGSSLAALSLLACAATETANGPHLTTTISLSEDGEVAVALESSLRDLLADIARGELTERRVDPPALQRDEFFFRALVRGAKGSVARPLKSYTLDGHRYRVTLAFERATGSGTGIPLVAELVAVPHEEGYRFESPFSGRAERLRTDRIGAVTFHHDGHLDRARAEEFVRTKAEIEASLGRAESGLDYYCFESLDELLRTYGLVHDATKCNFLGRDLGFLADGGRRYVTGTGDESYLFGYVRDLVELASDEPGEVFGPYVNGAAAYFGGYALSGDSMETLARQFREELARRPDIDFLAEFRKGRKSSVERHFSHYVMCAFVFRAIERRHGARVAFGVAACGANGERFHERMRELLDVDEGGFHDFIVEAIGASGGHAATPERDRRGTRGSA